jgi:uncharacterized protein YjaG (DUF416 family)
MYTYDENNILKIMAVIDKKIRPIFAASCTERLYPLFTRYSVLLKNDEVNIFKCTLDSIWRHLRGDMVLNCQKMEEAARWAENVGPTDESDWMDINPYAENAASALYYTIRACLTNDPQDCVWASRQTYEAVDYYVHNNEQIDFNQSDSEIKILVHSLIQQELKHQAEDMSDIRHITLKTKETIIDMIREKSRTKPVLPLCII